jgi:hypothetical protein
MPQLFNEIVRKGEEERRQIDKENALANARMALGATMQGASLLPVPLLKTPFLGSALSGALYDAGGAIVEGQSGLDIAKRAGRGALTGATVEGAIKAIPVVGRPLAKSKAGQAVINKANGLYNKIIHTDAGRKVGDFAKKAEDVLMTDIKAFNPNKQTVYHGSPYDFEKFSNEAIGSGEGAQAHGMGHYAAKNKDVADERYRKGLISDENRYLIDGEVLDTTPYDFNANALIGDAEYYGGIDNKINRLNNHLKESEDLISKYDNLYTPDEINADWELDMNYFNAQQDLERIPQELDFLNELRGKKISKNQGQLYKLSIPKDDVMLREGATFAEQPIKVQKALTDIQNDEIRKSGFNSIEEVRDRLNTVSDEYEKAIREQAVPFWAWGSTPVSDYQLELSKLERLNNMFDYGGSHKNIYTNLAKRLGKEETSSLLNQHGIKGISYNGGIDGEARVIFNPDDIEIVRKYYNQPSLYEKIIKAMPNAGAVSSYIINNQ